MTPLPSETPSSSASGSAGQRPAAGMLRHVDHADAAGILRIARVGIGVRYDRAEPASDLAYEIELNAARRDLYACFRNRVAFADVDGFQQVIVPDERTKTFDKRPPTVVAAEGGYCYYADPRGRRFEMTMAIDV